MQFPILDAFFLWSYNQITGDSQMTSFATYRKYWESRAAAEEECRKELHREALRVAGKLAEVLVRDFEADRVILFGSAVEEADFDLDSDLDLAVSGLSKGSFFRATATLMMESPFPVDLKPLEELTGLIREKVERGVILYEKRKNS